MKKMLLAALAAVLCLVSCEKAQTNKILGTWEAEKIYLNVEGFEMAVDIKEVSGGSIAITFKKDGTATMTESIEGESYSETCNYSYSDDILTLSYEDESISIPTTISGDILTMKVTPEMMEEEDIQGNMKIVWTRR